MVNPSIHLSFSPVLSHQAEQLLDLDTIAAQALPNPLNEAEGNSEHTLNDTVNKAAGLMPVLISYWFK